MSRKKVHFSYFFLDYLNMPVFADRLETRLKERKVTQKELAEFLQIRRPTISDWKKNGAVPPADVALKIAKFLDVDIWWLVFGESQEAPELTAEQKRLLASWEELSESDKEEIEMLIDFKNKAAKAKAVPADSVG